jgi:hypothetical protein
MQRVFDDVATYGWHVIGVSASAGDPEFSFTIGLFETNQHPELVVFGLPFKTAHGLLSVCVERLKQGSPFEAGQVRSDVLTRHRLAVLEVDRSFYSAYLGSAIGFYGDTDFPALQLVWPDRGDHFPWEPAHDPSYAGSQLVLTVSTQ